MPGSKIEIIYLWKIAFVCVIHSVITLICRVAWSLEGSKAVTIRWYACTKRSFGWILKWMTRSRCPFIHWLVSFRSILKRGHLLVGVIVSEIVGCEGANVSWAGLTEEYAQRRWICYYAFHNSHKVLPADWQMQQLLWRQESRNIAQVQIMQ